MTETKTGLPAGPALPAGWTFLHGRRLVSAAAVAGMIRPQIGELRVNPTEGTTWGWGWTVVREPRGRMALLAPGTFGQAGSYGTQVWIDPHARTICLVLLQRAKVTPNPDLARVRDAFFASAAALVAGPRN